MENKQEICNAICEALRKTRAAGEGNALKEIRYFKTDGGDEIARPIFENGSGENGFYDVNVTGDSGIAMFMDITDQFVHWVW